jgi:hypothetical protein
MAAFGGFQNGSHYHGNQGTKWPPNTKILQFGRNLARNVSDKLLAEERKKNENKNNNKKKRSKHNMSPKLRLGDIISIT